MNNLLFLLSLTRILAIQGWNFGNGYKYFQEQIKMSITQGVSNWKEKWITQRLDHFNDEEKRTWKMRYTENLEFWKKGSPIYLFIGGEASIGTNPSVSQTQYTSYAEEMAVESNAAMFMSEHRYYGESIPLNVSIVDNLKYLTSEQALADVSHLIRTIKSAPDFNNSKVVVFGCSYSGNLAAWMRVKYPEVVDAAWASSGPTVAKKDFFEFYQTFGNDLEREDPEKYKEIVQKYKKYDTLFGTDEGIQQLKKEENICEETDMRDPLNKAAFMCYALSSDYYNITLNKTKCFDFEVERVIEEYLSSDKMWYYQTCTEFGFYTTSRPPFTNYLTKDFYNKICSFFFGPEFDENRIDAGVAYTNQYYGGLTPNVTKVAYVYGNKDAWRSMGILDNLSDEAVSRVIPGGLHCEDLIPSRPTDWPELTETRKSLAKLIKHWLG